MPTWLISQDQSHSCIYTGGKVLWCCTHTIYTLATSIKLCDWYTICQIKNFPVKHFLLWLIFFCSLNLFSHDISFHVETQTKNVCITTGYLTLRCPMFFVDFFVVSYLAFIIAKYPHKQLFLLIAPLIWSAMFPKALTTCLLTMFAVYIHC